MKNVRPPQFVGNVYRDMRDRRLLIPFLVLVVALVAVPVLLKSHPSTSNANTVAISSAAKADSAAVPAVVTQQLGVTQYKKRLNQLNSKNPFHQQYTAVPKPARVHVSVGSTDTSASTPSTGAAGAPSTSSATATGSSSSATLSTPSTSSTTGGTTPTSSPPASSPPPSSEGSGGSSGTKHHMPTARYYAYRVGVKVGEPGKLKDRSEVKRMTMLPSSNRPLAVFLGVAEDGKHAIFQISTDVDSVQGDGQCAPQPANCQYLALKAGGKANLHYAPGNKRYNLILTDIHPVIVGNDKPPGKAKAATASGQGVPKLGPG
jgi:hypothetical protein